MESGYYPPGAEYDSNAPWNQVELPEKEIEVTVCISLSKTVKITVDDYKKERGKYDFSECDIYKAVEEQVILPHTLDSCKDWSLDDMECIIENE